MALDVESLWDDVLSGVAYVAPTIALALSVGIFGTCAVNKVMHFLHSKLDNQNKFDPLICKFAVSATKIGLKVLLVMTVLSMLHVDITSMLCLVSVMALAFGMAMTQVLENFVGGVMILLRRPYQDKDLIEIVGHRGRVNAISMFSTQIRTLDNRMVVVPNSFVTKHELIIFPTLPNMRLDIPVTITYESDSDKALEALASVAEEDTHVLKTPPPVSLVSGFGALGVELVFRCWVSNDDYSTAHFAINLAIKRAFDKAGVSFARHMYYNHCHINNL